MNHTIEIVTFKLNNNEEKSNLLATSPAMDEFLQQQAGFVYRSLSHNEQNLWHDIIYWKDDESAYAGADAFQNSEVGKRMMPLIDGPTCEIVYMHGLSETLANELAG